MHRTLVLLFLGLFLLLARAAVSALDIPVTYNVDDKALKNVGVGTSVLLTLYSDPACTNPVAS